MESDQLNEGDAFAFPLAPDRFGACRILQKDNTRIVVACSAWTGAAIPGVEIPELRTVLQPTHHNCDGEPCIINANGPPPSDFLFLGTIEPTPEEQAYHCRVFGGWDVIVLQSRSQWGWDHDREGVLAQEAADRMRIGNLIFGIDGLDQPPTSPRMYRPVCWQLIIVAIVTALLVITQLAVPASAGVGLRLAIVGLLLVCTAALVVLGQDFYESRIPHCKRDLPGTSITRGYSGPKWIPQIIGFEPAFYQRIISLTLFDMELSERFLCRCKTLRTLRMINLMNSRFTTEGVKHISQLPKLEFLWLQKSSITDAGLNQFAACVRLKWVMLNNTAITDSGMQAFKKLARLSRLEMNRTRITDVGLASLSKLHGIKTLLLDETQVTGSGFHLLSDVCTGMLSLDGALIDDAGLEGIGTLKKLKDLRLNRTVGSDVGLEYLTKMESLERLELAGTRVTLKGLFALEQLPRLEAICLGHHPNLAAIRKTFPQWTISPQS